MQLESFANAFSGILQFKVALPSCFSAPACRHWLNVVDDAKAATARKNTTFISCISTGGAEHGSACRVPTF
jgi:hypothetical protein